MRQDQVTFAVRQPNLVAMVVRLVKYLAKFKFILYLDNSNINYIFFLSENLKFQVNCSIWLSDLSSGIENKCEIRNCHISQGPMSYRQTSNISRTLVGNKIVDHSNVVEASPVGAAPTTSSFLT